ncbi:SMP-30/gluconolactonase/LRE family protein [Amycolatopsis pithecellobii]|nr:SMP-30/gluconolactonase/LRE family protein [Amycolatopsis pithecellobii]
MRHEAIEPSFESLLDLDGPMRRLGTGYDFVEGPIWHPTGHYLLFSDIPGDVRRRWDPSGVVEVARPARKGNGLTYDRELNLLVCEHVTSCVARYGQDGTRSELATHFEGRELNSPNDIVVRSDGSIYFTDPRYGRMPGYGVERAPELGFQGVYRIPPGGGDLQLLVDRTMFTAPNGLCFSPDENRLYVNDTDQANIRVFDVRADGTLENPRIFATGIYQNNDLGVRDDDLGVPDGMKCDEGGNVWVTGPGGVWVFAPDGRHIGKIRIPEKVANLHWGGPGWRTLFLTATTSLYAIDTTTGPRKEPFMQTGAG